MAGRSQKEAEEHGGETLGARQPKGSFEVGGTAVGMNISVCTSKQHPQDGAMSYGKGCGFKFSAVKDEARYSASGEKGKQVARSKRYGWNLVRREFEK